MFDELTNNSSIGIGIDLVSIKSIEEIENKTHFSFIKKTFTEREIIEANQSSNKYSYLAGRFAVKEATFKALDHLLKEESFDFRIVETLKDTDGSPYINVNNELKEIFKKLNVEKLLVSISNEDDYVIAIVQAIKK